VRPIAGIYADDILTSIRFESRPVKSYSGPHLPVVAVEDHSFMSWWKPNWRERLRLLLGGRVRVMVNYSTHGPLHLDTEGGWGDSSPHDW
jgi:hypothetical protein